jgi:hypothetical protein
MVLTPRSVPLVTLGCSMPSLVRTGLLLSEIWLISGTDLATLDILDHYIYTEEHVRQKDDMGLAGKFSRWCVTGLRQKHGPLGGSSFSSVPANQRVIGAMQTNRMY